MERSMNSLLFPFLVVLIYILCIYMYLFTILSSQNVAKTNRDGLRLNCFLYVFISEAKQTCGLSLVAVLRSAFKLVAWQMG